MLKTREQLALELILRLDDNETWDEQIDVICRIADGPYLPAQTNLIHQLFGNGAD